MMHFIGMLGQAWCTEQVPEEPRKELESMLDYKKRHSTCLLCDYVKKELAQPTERIVCQNDSFVALVPYWAIVLFPS